MEWTTPQKVLLRYGRPGMMLYGRNVIGDALTWETSFHIREEPRVIRRLGANPRVEIRAGLFVHQGVALIPVMVELSSWKETQRYESWINIHQDGIDGSVYLNDLATQPRIAIFLYTDSEQPEHQIQVPNRMQEAFAEIAVRAQSLPPWTMQDFDRAREDFYQLYPMDKLWDALRAEQAQ